MQAMLGNTLRKHLGAPECSSHHKHMSSTSLCRLLACNRAAGAGCKSPTFCTSKWQGVTQLGWNSLDSRKFGLFNVLRKLGVYHLSIDSGCSTVSAALCDGVTKLQLRTGVLRPCHSGDPEQPQ